MPAKPQPHRFPHCRLLPLALAVPATVLCACSPTSPPARAGAASDLTPHLLSASIHRPGPQSDDCPICALYEAHRDAIVRITAGQGLGTGLVLAPGLIITNAHVVGESGPITIETFDGHTTTATRLKVDAPGDLALIRAAESTFTWSAARMSVDAPVRVGSDVFVIGHPVGLGWTITQGVVSARRRANEVGPYEAIQIDAPVSPGNSGGPALDASGRWIGLVSSKLVGPGLENIAFVIPAPRVRQFLADTPAR